MVKTTLAVRKPICYNVGLLSIGLLAFAPMKAASEPFANNVVFDPTPIAEQKIPLTGGLPYDFKPNEVKPRYELRTPVYKKLHTPDELRVVFCYAGGGCGTNAGGH